MKRSIAALVFLLFLVLLVGTVADVASAADVPQYSVLNLGAATSATPYASNYCLQVTNSSRHFYYYQSSQCSTGYPGNSYSSFYNNHYNPYYYTYYPYNTGYPYNYMYSYGNYPYDYGYNPYYYNGNYYPDYYYYSMGNYYPGYNMGGYYPGGYGSTPTSTPMTFELKVGTNPTGVGSVSGAGTYNQGTVASFSIASPIISKDAGERYVFSSWSGDFAGTSPSGTVTLDSAKTVVANYQLQNYLGVSAAPQGIVSVTGAGWYPADASVAIASVPPTVSAVEGTQYVFQGWTIDAVPASGNTISVTMDKPHSVVAQYKTQYLLTISSEYGTIQGAGWYDAGSTATLFVTPRVDTSYGVSQVFDRWTGALESTQPTGTITMNSPSTVVAVWRTDSTVLYATIGVAVGAVFVLGIGLVALAISRRPKANTSSSTPPSQAGANTK